MVLTAEDIHDSYCHIICNNAKQIFKAFNTVTNNHTKRGSGLHAGKSNSHIYKTFNPADFITSIINGESIAKDCRKQVMLFKIIQVHSLFIYLNKLMLIDTGFPIQ